MGRTTIEDISKITGFSIKTISRVINQESGVREKTREKILKIIEEYNYSPNIFAKNLKENKSYSIGLIVHNITNPYMPQLIETIEREISTTRYNILLSISDINEKSKRNCIRTMIDKMVDGIIMTNVYKENYSDLEYLKKIGIPLVFVLNRLPNFECDYVGADFYFGSIKMMQYLFSIGLKKIAFITGSPDNISNLERLKAYKDFLLGHGIPYDDSLVETGNFKYEGGFDAFNKLISNNDDIEAIFCVNDFTALGAMNAAKKAKFKVPEDIMIVGFNDMQFASHSNIKLTTMRIPILKMARTAVEILFDQINGGKQTCKKVILKPELVVRQ